MRNYVEPFLKHTLGFLAALSAVRRSAADYLTAGVILAVMTFPFIISISREVAAGSAARPARGGPGAGRDALGIHLQVVVPYARLGILGSIFLALARALGETMAVTMVIGNDPKIHPRCLRRTTRSPR